MKTMPLKKTVMSVLSAAFLSGCAALTINNIETGSNRHNQPLPSNIMSLMSSKNLSKEDPILLRIFKKENELEVWKQTDSGQYALMKTYPICRWSGRLGPKKREGDRQAPEGFYNVNPGLMNPNSNFHLSFNLGYPNSLERSLGRNGQHLMVHGACSSAGCYAMGDVAMTEIYGLAREAFRGGQRSFQVQAYPFRMTQENMEKFAADEHIDFWRNLRQGYDIFAHTKKPLQVSACGGRYVFHARARNGQRLEPGSPCPALEYDLPDNIIEQVMKNYNQPLTPTFAQSPNMLYFDGDMHPVFREKFQRLGSVDFARAISTTAIPANLPAPIQWPQAHYTQSAN